MSVKAMVAVGDRVAKGEPAKMPAIKFSDWPLFCRCLKESMQKK